jgi:cytochrome bd-type quinol oxidase subunit 1
MFKSFKSTFDGIQFPFSIMLFQLLLVYVALFMAVSNPGVNQPGISVVLLAFAGFGCLCTIAGWASKIAKKVENLEAQVNELRRQNNP